jgi:hypothetical protein
MCFGTRIKRGFCESHLSKGSNILSAFRYRFDKEARPTPALQQRCVAQGKAVERARFKEFTLSYIGQRPNNEEILTELSITRFDMLKQERDETIKKRI